MKNLIFTIAFLWILGTQSIYTQVISDSLKITNDNCAIRLAKDYMLRMGTVEQNKKTISFKIF